MDSPDGDCASSGSFDPYAAIAALDEVVNVTKERKDERASRYEIVLRQCRPLLNNPCLQQVLIKLVASKEEAEVAKVIAMETTRPVPVNQGSFTGRTRKAPYQRRDTNRSPRSPPKRKCWVRGKAVHISCFCQRAKQRAKETIAFRHAIQSSNT